MSDVRVAARRGAALSRTALVIALGVLLRALPADAAGGVTPELQAKINAAVDKGAAWLAKQRNPDGSFPAVIVNNAPAHVIGTTSLASLALLAAEVPKKDPAWQETLKFLQARDGTEGAHGTRSTYGTGCLLMFLTEFYRPIEEKKEKPKPGETVAGRHRVNPCALPKEVAAWVQELATWLVQAQMESGGWRYPTYPPADLSNTQYAMLGLRAARDCGASVPLSCFQRAMDWAMTLQQADGPDVKRRIAGSGKPGEIEYAVGVDKARGFGYQSVANQITGSMTTAGIAVIAIAYDALTKPSRTPNLTVEIDHKIQRDVQDGFAWLDKNFAVDKNPPPGSGAWHYYYLYGLERACTFGGREKVGLHDWYAEGATYLVGKQQADGRWSTGALGGNEIAPSDMLDTAWALLFLKKATRPFDVPMPVITQGG